MKVEVDSKYLYFIEWFNNPIREQPSSEPALHEQPCREQSIDI